ncbi:MAG: carboxypeptidase-like regulatory domain-containing protein [Lacunisphaera sp.]
MKTRRWVLIAAVAILLGLLLWRSRDKRLSAADAATPAAAPVQSSSDVSKKETVSAEPAAAPANTPIPPQPPGKREQMREILSKFNDKEIEFYGKVVDQTGTPIPNVNVTGSVIYNNGVSSGVQEKHTVTDAAGLFSFSGMRGRTFDYHLEKTGYETMPEGDAFDYTELVPEAKRHHPDPKNPVVLKMWKLQGAEPMIHMGKDFKIPPDGTPIRIDLTTGKRVTQGGDLIITLRHEILAPGAEPKRGFDWNAQIAASEGGIVETTQRLMYLAPEKGYTPALAVDMPANKSGWQPGVDSNFYLQSRGQIYSRVMMHLNANPDQERGSYLSLTWWLNPKPGSRNLEFDPAKVVSVKP